MKRSDFGSWLQQSYTDKEGVIWVEQPDGSFAECDPFRLARSVEDTTRTLLASAYKTRMKAQSE